MGHNQIWLMILVTTLVVIAIAVGVEQFQTLTVDSNRQAVMADLVNYGSKAQLYFRTSRTLGGGSQDFKGFKLSPFENTNSNGEFHVTPNVPSGPAAVTSGGEIFISATTIYIQASGRKTGTDNTNPVKVFVTVDRNTITTTILN